MGTQVVEYDVSDAAIAQLKQQYGGLTAETPAKYEEVRKAIAETRTLRVKVEKTRKELKADALEYGRKVDAEAKRITALLLEVEDPLKAEKQKVDDEKARIQREKEEAEQRRIEEEQRKQREAEEAKRKAEEERIRAEQEAERKKLEAERAELEKQRKEEEAKRKAEQEKLDAERRKIEEERQRLEREQFEREAKERAEREAREKAEREAEAKRLAEERAEQERQRLESLKPDVEKMADFAQFLNSIDYPELSDESAREKLESVGQQIDAIVEGIETWCRRNRAAEKLEVA